MRFRPATPADVPHVVPMLVAQYALHIKWEPAKFGVVEGFEVGYGRWLVGRTGDERAVFLVATSDSSDEPVGFVVGTTEKELPLYTTKEYGFIHDIFVEEAYRNEGAARQLVTLAVERFKAMGLRQVRCETAIPNEAARALFGKCGFRAAATTMLAET